MIRLLCLICLIASAALAAETNSYTRAVALHQAGRWTEALAAWNEVLEDNPGATKGARSYWHYCRAFCAHHAGVNEVVLSALDALVDEDEASGIVTGGTADAYRATALVNLGRQAEAVPHLERALQKNPDDLRWLNQLAVLKLSLKDYKGAADASIRFLCKATAPAELRPMRGTLNSICRTIEKTELAENGKTFAGQGVLVKTQAVIAAENSGQGFGQALAALGIALPPDWDALAAKTRERADMAIAGQIDPDGQLLARIELIFGVAGAKKFETDYNRGAQ